jgi:hypothetical protein
VISTEGQYASGHSPASTQQEIKVSSRVRGRRFPTSIRTRETKPQAAHRYDAGTTNSVRRESLAAFAEAVSNTAEEIYLETSKRYRENREQIMRESAKTIGVVEED